MKKTKKKLYSTIRIFFYMLVELFVGYFIFSKPEKQQITITSICELIFFIIVFFLLSWQVAKLYFATKIFHNKIKETDDAFKPIVEKAEAAAKEAKELVDLVKNL